MCVYIYAIRCATNLRLDVLPFSQISLYGISFVGFVASLHKVILRVVVVLIIIGAA